MEKLKNYRAFFIEAKKGKAFYKNLSKWLKTPTSLSAVQVALNVSSFITHCLIELDARGSFIYDAMDVGTLSMKLSALILGTEDVDDFRVYFEKNYGKYF